MMQRVVTDEDLRRAVDAARRANARGNAEWNLRYAGHTLTPKNSSILDILEETRGQHPTARDIHEELLKRHPSAQLTSIYPVLHALESVSLVQSRRFGRLPKHFDVRVDPHVDVQCTGCGAIEEVEIDPTAGSADARLTETRKGLCRACSAGAASKGAA